MDNQSIIIPELVNSNDKNFRTDFSKSLKLIKSILLYSQEKDFDKDFIENIKTILNSFIKQQLFLRNALEELKEVDQICGKTLGYYPWYKDDQDNFPGATEEDGVCTGDHTAITIVSELIEQYKNLKKDSLNAKH